MSDNSSKCLYLQYGCGLSVGKGWVNYDSSPTLRLQRATLLGKFASRAAGAVIFPKEVRHGDIRRGLLAAREFCAGIYASHVLEHLALEDFRKAIGNTFDMLRPGGLFRLVVPDLEVRARRYIELREDGSAQASFHFMLSTQLGATHRARGFSGQLREQFGNSRHLWMWDEASMERELRGIGFVDIRRCRFHDFEDPLFREVEDLRRFVDEEENLTELAMECRKPLG